MTKNTDKTACVQLAALLAEHRVRRVFVSPGSRNAPIIVAIARQPELSTTVVVDERVAAFMAMGYALISGSPVALVCTSGTALLNYAPAVAEAYYRKVPLIVVSADRPMEWIDQDDSQTLRQPGALANYVKLSCDIPEVTTPNLAWYANRKINDAILSALSGRKAPVHINIQLDAPLGVTRDYKAYEPRVISIVEPAKELPAVDVQSLSDKIVTSRAVLVIAGFNAPDATLNTALERLSQLPNVAVMTETISNLHSPRFISAIDTTLSSMTSGDKAKLAPEIVITVGGALVSRFVKEYLRAVHPAQHWHVGVSHTTIDCLQSLTMRVEMDAGAALSQLADCCETAPITPSDYAERWHEAYMRGIGRRDTYVAAAGWSDMQALAYMLPRLPKQWNLQLSNGTPIRYAQLFGDLDMHRSDCNRGVSGIDGCTSTAIGASLAYDGVTVLVTGDISAQYDVGALGNVRGLNRFKMIVMCNGGGGIFRFVESTRQLPELDTYFAFAPELPLQALAQAYGMSYYQADSSVSLKTQFEAFVGDADAPALLAVMTPADESAEILNGFLRANR